MSESTSFSTTFSIGNDRNVNRLGYGAMRITGKGVWGPPAHHDEAIKVLKRAIELGVNFIDTADSYGPNISEELIAEALYPYPDNLVIATKGGFERTGPDIWIKNGHPDHLRKVLEGSLKRLKLDRIALYQLHRIDQKVPAEQTFEFLKKVQEEGKVQHIGLSEVGVDEIKNARQYFEVVSVQNKYSVDNRTWEPVLDYCKRNNIAFIPGDPLNAGDVNAQEKIKQIADKNHATSHQVALSWLLHHASNILLIPGTSNVSHLEENMQSITLTLTKEDLEVLDHI
jgi:aryl-alcohol dehydrogenase-like predicted oxidoreductase